MMSTTRHAPAGRGSAANPAWIRRPTGCPRSPAPSRCRDGRAREAPSRTVLVARRTVSELLGQITAELAGDVEQRARGRGVTDRRRLRETNARRGWPARTRPGASTCPLPPRPRRARTAFALETGPAVLGQRLEDCHAQAPASAQSHPACRCPATSSRLAALSVGDMRHVLPGVRFLQYFSTARTRRLCRGHRAGRAS